MLEEVENGLLKRDAVIGVSVVGGHVDLVDLLIAGFVEGFDEGVIGWGEAVVGGEDEDVASGKFRCGCGEVPGGGVGDEFVGKGFGCGAGEWGHAFVSEMSGDGFDDGVVLVSGE